MRILHWKAGREAVISLFWQRISISLAVDFNLASLDLQFSAVSVEGKQVEEHLYVYTVVWRKPRPSVGALQMPHTCSHHVSKCAPFARACLKLNPLLSANRIQQILKESVRSLLVLYRKTR